MKDQITVKRNRLQVPISIGDEFGLRFSSWSSEVSPALVSAVDMSAILGRAVSLAASSAGVARSFRASGSETSHPDAQQSLFYDEFNHACTNSVKCLAIGCVNLR